MEAPENAVGDVSVDVVRSNSFAFGYPTANGKLVTPKATKGYLKFSRGEGTVGMYFPASTREFRKDPQ